MDKCTKKSGSCRSDTLSTQAVVLFFYSDFEVKGRIFDWIFFIKKRHSDTTNWDKMHKKSF